MNSINKNYQPNFQSSKSTSSILKKQAEKFRTTRFCRDYKSTPKDTIPYTCSKGGEPMQLEAKLYTQIRNLEKYIEEHPNDIEAKAQLSKIKDAIKDAILQ